MLDLPTGTVTFLFTDIEGSTNLARILGSRWPGVLQEHQDILRAAILDHGGVEVRTEGDAFFVVFGSAVDAVAASTAAQRALVGHTWPPNGAIRVRMGLHTGEGRLGQGDYVGLDVHRAARIAASGHGGQVLISEATRSVVEDALPDGAGLRDLGPHRLKDFDQPQRIHQLAVGGLPADFPPIRTLEIPTNLPVRLTSFIGRERELVEITDLLDSARLVTLTGPGGTGKTRLALRVATDVLERFADGVFFVELAPITDPHLVPSVIGSTLGIGEEGPRPILETLKRELRDRTTLLVLDNFEQVVEAGWTVGAILGAAPRVRALVTSRAPLQIEGERESPVSPLGLPDPAQRLGPADAGRYEAVTLFQDRAAAVDATFALTEENAEAVARICTLLDGLPLAIELAASRLRLLNPQALVERLDRSLALLAGGSRDLPARQRTLRGAIAWSHDLLDEEHRTLFRRLAVFAGGFTLETAEAVCDPDGDIGVDLLDGLQSLLNASLVRRKTDQPGAVRFDLLETIREFGLERLEEDDQADVIRRRHALYFLALAQAAKPKLREPGFFQVMGGLAAEHENLRTAMAWAVANDQGEVALRMIEAFWRFWHFHGDLSAGRRWADQALALPSGGEGTDARAKALIGRGSLAYWQNDTAAALLDYEEALSILEAIGDPAGAAEGRYNLAFVEPMRGNVEKAIELFRSSMATFQELGDRRGTADAQFGLAVMSRLQGDLTTAAASAEQALVVHQDLGDVFGLTGELYVLGRVAAETGDLDTARRHYLQTLENMELIQERTGIALILDNLANLANLGGRPHEAMRLAGASESVKELVGGEAPPELIHLPDPRAQARELLSEDEIEVAWAEGRAMSLEQALSYARDEPG
jgi:predicted ATPase/class 3 adenylate cyclase